MNWSKENGHRSDASFKCDVKILPEFIDDFFFFGKFKLYSNKTQME